MIQTIWNKIGFKQLLTRKNAQFIFISWLLSVLCYLPMIANGVTNSADGLWITSYHQAGSWEISTGRWAWPILDKLRMGYAADPFNSFLALLLITTAAWLTIQVFSDLTKKHYMYVLLITVSTTTCCYLSYRFQSPSFGMATLLPIIAVFLISNKSFTGKESWIVNSLIVLFLVLTLALYQANLGIFCVLVVFLFMKYILEDDLHYGFKFITRAILISLVSCVLYKTLWEVCLKLRNIEASDYNGADSSFITILKNIPVGIKHAYVNLMSRRFLFDGSNYIYKPIRLLIYTFIFGLLIYIATTKLKGNFKAKLWYFIALLLIPLAANICFILTPSVQFISMQMTAPILFSGITAICFIENYALKLKKLITFSIALLLYGNIYCVGTDEDAMIQGHRSMEAVTAQVVSTLDKMDAISTDKKYVFIGSPCKNELFRKNELWDKASPYAQTGDIWPNLSCTVYTYNGLLDHIGIQLNMADSETYERYMRSNEFKNMPCYPDKGSIVVHEDEVVVKISNRYFVESENE
ncbi:MAG: glucosyltransferase domain-containing protein [Pseudobutyrivibrio sp.]|nr:glucosyltransferase domain-containing protein [Pseudobutyrivibrio sp.]